MKIFNGAKYDVLSLDDFKLFSDLKDASYPTKDSEHGKKLIALADEALKEEIPQLYASVYRQFYINGNRTNYQVPYFARRTMLKKLLIGEIIQNEGRYTDKIIDVLWLIMEETSWVIPAHNFSRAGTEKPDRPPLPEMFDENVTYIDLFSAETAAVIAFVYYYMKEKFDKAVPEIINDRILYLLRRRIITPFLNFDNMWWMGYVDKKPNNWNPWIISNVLTVAALAESDKSIRQRVVNKSMECLDLFIDHYNPDGGCDEGPGYWNAAGASYFDCLEIIYDMTGGKADYFTNPLIYNVCDYIRKVHITDNCFTTFADCAPILYTSGLAVGVRMGIRTENNVLKDFASSLTKDFELIYDYSKIYRNYKNIAFRIPECGEFKDRTFDILEYLQIGIIRNENGYTVAAKGGCNAESHNHNDVGNAIVFVDKKPVLIDIGGPTYTKDTFSDKRYTIFPINSTWHNLPVINGIGEKEGAAFVCDAFEADESKIKIEYQSAYEKEVCVEKAIREINVCDEGIDIIESVTYTGSDIQFNYYLPAEPAQSGNTFTFADGIKIICPNNFECALEPIPLSDDNIKQRWNCDTLYRIVIKSTKDGLINFSVKITK